MENLKLKNMVGNGNKSFNCCLFDFFFGVFIRIFFDKVERVGWRVVFVELVYILRICFCCGFVVEELFFLERVFCCLKCGLVMDRDLNVFFNILKRGLDEGLG